MSIGDSRQMPEHGGEVDAAAERYGIARDQWLDLSTGINPKPYPLPELAREYFDILPASGMSATAITGLPIRSRSLPRPARNQ